MNRCFLCTNPGVVQCKICECSWACSEFHLKLHYSEKYGCFPVRLEYSDEAGQSLVATKNILPNEIIIHDNYSVLVSVKGGCIVCKSKIGDDWIQCPDCNLIFFCSSKCATSHVIEECSLFSKTDIDWNQYYDQFYESLMALRLLMIQKSSKEQWSRIERLLDHRSFREKDKTSWEFYQKNVVNFIRGILKLGHVFTKFEIERVIGIIRINAIQTKDYKAIYPTMALLNNSCISNARCVHSENEAILIVSQKPILAGEEINIGYQSLFKGSLERKTDFRSVWFFDCRCSRCVDPTELGSHYCSVWCPKGDGGLMTPPVSLDIPNSECSLCKTLITITEFKSMNLEFSKSILETESLTKASQRISGYKDLLAFYSKKFPPQNFLMLKIKSQLISLYGNGPGYYYHELSLDDIQFKIKLCEEFINVVSKIDPGFTEWKAATDFEKTQAQIYILQTRMENELPKVPEEKKPIMVDSFKKHIQEMILVLTDCKKVLSLEKEDSYLKKISLRSAESIKVLRDLTRFINFL